MPGYGRPLEGRKTSHVSRRQGKQLLRCLSGPARVRLSNAGVKWGEGGCSHPSPRQTCTGAGPVLPFLDSALKARMTIDPFLALAAFGIGIVVGLTGMGGGALMTPVLVLFFSVPPLTAVSSDLVASA